MSFFGCTKCLNSCMHNILNTVLISVLMVFFGFGLAYSANRVEIGLAESGSSTPVDTIHLGLNYEFQISLENDVLLGGMQLGLKITSPDGATWGWDTQTDGYGPQGYQTGGQYMTVVSGSRMDPAGTVWDLTDLLLIEKSMNGVSPDTAFLGGASQWNGLAIGALEHMMSIHFSPSTTGSICIDSAFIPPAGDWIFADAGTGLAVIPTINGPYCWPVAYACPFDSDGDGFGDPGHPENNCPDDNCPQVANPGQEDTDGDGVGNACDICEGHDDNLDADSDGVPDGCDICAGFDDNLDADADGVPDGCDICEGFDDALDADSDGVPDGCDICAGFDDNADADSDGVPDGCDICEGFDDALDADADGVPDGCDLCEGFDDALDADSDGVPDGCDICAGFDDNADADSDGVPDGCDICEGHDDNLDADSDGVPDGCDICAGFDDNADADSDGVPDGCDICEGFDDNADVDVDGVPDGCDNCPGDYNPGQEDSDGDQIGDVCDWLCGDGNSDGAVNLADASFVINYIFYDGPEPSPIESGDANCDGALNLADASYIINYIFYDGTAPCCPEKSSLIPSDMPSSSERESQD